MLKKLELIKNIHDEIYDDVSNIWGDASNIYGNASNIYGSVSNIWGNVSDIYGYVSDICGNLDLCDISDEERKYGVCISELVSK